MGGLLPQRVLFAPDIYIVPRRDGRIVIGATSEGIYTPQHPVGIQALLERAIRLYPHHSTIPSRNFGGVPPSDAR